MLPYPTSSHTKCLQHPELGLAKVLTWVVRTTALEPSLLPPKFTLAGDCNQELELDVETRCSDVGRRHLNARLDAHFHTGASRVVVMTVYTSKGAS